MQVKQAFVGKDHKGDVPLHLKIASGLTTGAIAITVASPTDLVKVGDSMQWGWGVVTARHGTARHDMARMDSNIYSGGAVTSPPKGICHVCLRQFPPHAQGRGSQKLLTSLSGAQQSLAAIDTEPKHQQQPAAAAQLAQALLHNLSEGQACCRT